MLRIRDFIETEERLIFSVVSYYHPSDSYVAFLRYYPSRKGQRERAGAKFKKISSTLESFEFLERDFPEYLFFSDVMNSTIQCVPIDKISKIYHPGRRLKEIYQNPEDILEQKILRLSEAFNEIHMDKKGVTGSALVNLYDEKTSDIDFVIYGIKSHGRARDILRGMLEKRGDIRSLNKSEWLQAYNKRFAGHKTLSFEEFLWHEKRKFHKGVINGTIFDILLVRDFDEIKEKYSEKKFRRIKKITSKCIVTDSSLAFDSPAIYKVACKDGRIKEVVSFTHTYAGQAFESEEIEVSGFLEEVTGRENYLRAVVGTTREARGEYIKAAKN